MPEQRTQSGQADERIGVQMIAIEPGTPVTVDATLTPLGEGIMVDATVTATLTGQCSRCLTTLHPDYEVSVNEVFAATDTFIQGEDAEDDDDVPQVAGDTIDLTQSLIDAVGLDLPFNPVCDYFGLECGDAEVPAPDGVSGEEDERPDPRWAGLEKFK
ncbi:YceD family protein [Corynebacterium sp. H128]